MEVSKPVGYVYYNLSSETYIFIMFLFVYLIEFRYNNKYKKLN